jgi:S-DNA-T family DNA segregation ATPase FtsK/SpoIIIE
MTAEPLAVEPPQDAPAPRPVARPILPDWLHSRSTIVNQARWGIGYYGKVFLFHAIRIVFLVYWWRIARRAPWGIGRIARLLARWVMDAPGTTMRTSIAHNTGKEAADGKVFVELTKQHRQTVSGRLFVIVLALAGLGFLAYATLRDPWLIAAVSVATLTLFGLVGRSLDHPIVSRYGDHEEAPRPTAEKLVDALDAIGVAKLKREDIDVKWSGRDGRGWRADVDLPLGVTAGQVVEMRDRLASGLRQKVSCVWPEAQPEIHAGRLVVWVADKAMSDVKPLPWSLTKAGKVDLFQSFPIGETPRGNVVPVTLMFASMVIGAVPRMGKSFTLRLLLLAAALDPIARLHVYDLKGGADFLPLEPVAHRFRIGDDEDDIEYLLDDLRTLVEEMRERYRTIRTKLTRDECPEGKVTAQLATHRDHGLFPAIIALDECQKAFESKEHGKEIEALVTDLVKRGPAAGIITICATQRPDKASLPPQIRSNAVLRFCLKVTGHDENNMVLGPGAYANGTRATMFAKTDWGVGYLVGEGEDPVICRAAYVDAPTAETIVKRARAARQTLGLLTGHAIGDDGDPQDEEDSTILDELVTVWPSGRPHVWLEELAERLQTAYPVRHGGCTADLVREAVAPHGIRTKKVNAKDVAGEWRTRAGITWEALHEALRGDEEGPEDRCDPQDAA